VFTPDQESPMTISDSTITDAGRVTLAWDSAQTVATVLIDRPAKLNALTLELLDELFSCLLMVHDSDARVVVLRGAGEKAFCVGADINRFAPLTAVQMWRDWTATGHRVFDALAGLRQPTVAVLHGATFGGGLELALACDFRVVATEARIGLPEVGLGTVPGWGGTERLTELVGRARAKEVVLSRRTLDGELAHTWGVATRVAPRAELDSAVDELVTPLLGGAPVAVQLAKQIIDAAAEGAPSRVLEALAGGLTSATEDLKEGIAAFQQRREATFTGR
jgi:enoyl-CoA hydratase